MTDAAEFAGWEEEQDVVGLEWLLARTKQGDPGALGELFRQWGPMIRRVVRRGLSKKSPLRRLFDSSDLAQSVFVRLLERLGRGAVTAATVSAFKELVEQLVEHEIADTWRRLTARHRDLQRTVSLDAMKGAIVGDAQEPWQTAYEHEQVERLVRLMNAEEYELVRLRLLGCGWEELATRYRTTVTSLRSRYYRLRKRIRSQLFGGGQE